MEGWLEIKKENDGGLVGGKPVVQRRESSADLVFLGYLRSLCPLQRHEQSYIDSFVRYYTSPGWLAFIILFTVLGGFLGSLVGGKLVNKHFKKAGVL